MSETVQFIIAAGIFLLEAAVLATLILGLAKGQQETLYSYRNAGLVGGIIYVAFTLVCTAIALSTMTSGGQIHAATGSISLAVSYFLIVLLPILFLLFAAVSVSNIFLIRHEGKSLSNMLGAFMWVFFVAATLLCTFGWDLVYQYVIFPIYVRGNQWITIVDSGVPLFFSGLLCYLECILIGTIVYEIKVLRNAPDYDADYAIILGCAINRDGTPRPLLRGRIDRAIEFAEAQEKASGRLLTFIPSGGRGSDECISEAQSMKNYLLSRGIPEERIIMEDRSVSTLENMKFSKAIIDGRTPGAKAVFSTTNYHVFRSGIYAHQVGLKADGIGSSTKLYFWPNAFIREFIALLVSRRHIHIVVSALIFVFSGIMAVVNYFTLLYGVY